ncbi:response regulator transcription factor [Lactobacillus sp. DCY120]|uniref:Response regulator transcription factor n=1 Tax=Bombilactobacillus apium TaxID=2675299 RepID=A0A850R161_9LACO|nr:response regulator transcription factor [Bombilactobacillus apium]NVY96829.1 response regulator transcription factor [Bombilactobacillus apium]
MTTILVVDDELALLELLRYNLEQQQFQVVTAADGQKALELLEQQPFDLVILDLMLPIVSGWEVIQRLRARQMSLPVLMLSALDKAPDKVRGLNLGADDYLAKPFDLAELISRIQALLRRSQLPARVIKSSSKPTFVIDEANFCIYQNQQLLNLTKTEYQILYLLCQEANRVVTRPQIAQALWGSGIWNSSTSRAIDIQISHLRDKIEQNSKQPQYLKTVRGFGYRLLNQKE